MGKSGGPPQGRRVQRGGRGCCSRSVLSPGVSSSNTFVAFVASGLCMVFGFLSRVAWLLDSVAFGFWLSWLSSHAKKRKREGRQEGSKGEGLWLLRFSNLEEEGANRVQPEAKFGVDEESASPTVRTFSFRRLLSLPGC